MNGLKIALGIAVAVLVLMLVIDNARAPAQLKAVKDSVDQLADATRQQAQELRRLSQALEAGRVAVPAAGQAAASAPERPAAAGGPRDGKPRLGGNFLKPVDPGIFDPKRAGGVLRQYERAPTKLNLLTENMASARAAANLMHDSLCSQAPATPDLWSEELATGVIIADDWKRFTFTIRPGVRWHRPALAREPGYAWLDKDVELTAHDFAFYIEMLLSDDVECPHLKAYYSNLASARALDDRTFEVVWKESEYINIDQTLGLTPLPRHIYGADKTGRPVPAEQRGALFNKHWFDEAKQFVGVGRYRLEKFEPTQRLELAVNPDYWGVPYHFRGMVWDGVVVQPDPQLVGFKNNQVHYHGLAPTQYKSEILDRKEQRFAAIDPKDAKAGRTGAFGWERVVGSGYAYIGWNLRRPQFADKAVRLALAHAFPKQRVIEEVFMGLGRPQVGPDHPDAPHFNRDLKDFAFDLAKAREILAQAGWADHDGDGWLDRTAAGKKTDLRFKVCYYGAAPTWTNLLSIYRDCLRQVGIDLEPLPIEDTEWERRMENRDFDAMCAGWSIGLDADYFQLWHSKYADEPKSSNHAGFRNARVDELAARLRKTFDHDQRIAIAREVQALIFAEQPYLFVRCGEGVFIWHARRQGADDRRELLDGVEDGFRLYHPLRSRSPDVWRIVPAP